MCVECLRFLAENAPIAVINQLCDLNIQTTKGIYRALGIIDEVSTNCGITLAGHNTRLVIKIATEGEGQCILAEDLSFLLITQLVTG